MSRYFTFFLTLILGIFLLLGFSHSNTALTQDLGRHLLLGEMILETLIVPTTNLFSYTYPDFPFINSHYLSEVIFFLFTSVFGIDSLIFLGLIIIAITYVTLITSAKKSASLFGISIASLLLFRVWFERTDIRPELFSFFFAAVFISLLYQNRSKPTRLIYLLIPLSLFWTQLHIYFAIGYFLIFLFLLDGIFSRHLKSKQSYLKTLSLVFAGVCLVTLLNPNGIDGALYPFRVFENYGYTIEENQTMFFLQSLGFLKPSFPYFTVSVLTIFLTYAVVIKKTYPIDWLLAVSFTIIAWSAVRNFPLFAIILFIPFTRLLSELQSLFSKNLSKQQTLFARITFATLVTIVIIWQFASVSSINGVSFDTKDPGKDAIAFFKSEKIEGPLFNNFDIGSYLIYRLFPYEKVFVDGRPEAYPAEFFTNVYIPMQESPEIFTSVSNTYKFNSIVFSHTDQTPWAKSFLYTIVRDPIWTSVYLDPTMIILVKNIPENASVIQSHGMDLDTLQFSNYKEDSMDTLLKAANFASTIQQTSLEKKVYRDILGKDPSFCPVIYNLARILTAENDPTAVIYTSKYSQTCVR